VAAFRDLPIRRKVTLIIVAATGLSLLLAAAGVLAYDITTFRPRMRADLSAQAEIVAMNTVAALEFNDSVAAGENLATLSAHPGVAATIYDSTGAVFASHPAPGEPLAALPPGGERFTEQDLTITRPIEADGAVLGWLVLRTTFPPLITRLSQYGLLVGVLMLTLASVSWMLSRMLRRNISGPLLRLADTARTIGRQKDYRVRALKDSDDEIGAVTDAFNGMLGTIESSQAALRESTRQLEDAMLAADMAHWRWDVARDAITWGGAEHRIFPPGAEPRDSSLGALLDVLDPADREPAERALRSAARTDGSCEFDLRIVAPGETRWFVMRGRAERGPGLPGLEVIGLAVDITERRTLELQLAQSQKMEAIGRLAGGIAHDFNNLLTAILGYARFAMSGLPVESQTREDVRQIQLAGERAAALTGQLLAYARRTMVAPRTADLNQLVLTMQQMLRRLIGEDIVLELDCDPGLWTTRLDPAQLEQVLLNLVLNARDALPSGGAITITTRNEVVDPAEARADPEVAPGEYVAVTVADNGMGMDAATLARVFEPFFTTKEQGKGTGLGLAVCYGIVRQAGGHIRASSEPGRGSKFAARFPRAEVGAVVEAPAAPRAAPDAGRETVLVVEDESSVRALATRTLASFGYHVLEAADGSAAVALARSHAGTIDLVVTDVVMPEMGGRAVAEAIAAERPDVRFVFMSGYTDQAVRREHDATEGGAFLTKPFHPDELARTVRAVLDRDGALPAHGREGLT